MLFKKKISHNNDSIIHHLQAGNPECVKMIFDNYYRALCVYALRYLPSIDDAEDVVQGVIVSFWERWKRREFVGSVHAYLFAAVAKSSLKFLDKNGYFFFDDIEDHVNQFLDEVDDYEEGDLEILKHRLYEEVNNLPERAKEVFNAIVLENLSYKQVADRYQISVNTVKTHYSHALKKLRMSLGDLFVYFFMI